MGRRPGAICGHGVILGLLVAGIGITRHYWRISYSKWPILSLSGQAKAVRLHAATARSAFTKKFPAFIS
jgi:hypothetical protein